MTRARPRRPSTSVARVATPAAVVDVDVAAANHEHLRRQAGDLTLRPHFKAHKTSALLALQRSEPSAVCTQTAAEAVVVARAGADDILVTNEVVDPAALDALAVAARSSSVGALVDHADHVALLGQLCARAGVGLDVLIEIDVGMRRCGVPPDSTALVQLADDIQRTPGLRLRGLQAYEGHAAGIADIDMRTAVVADAGDRITVALGRLAGAFDRGAPLVGGGSTATTAQTSTDGRWTETQAGSYLLMDGAYGAMGDLPFRQAWYLVATVLHSSADHVVVDVGLKSAAVDRGAPQPVAAGMTTTRVSDEHSVVELDGVAAPLVGDRMLLVPGHVDPTMNLYPEIALVRGLDVAAPWESAELIDLVPVDGRREVSGRSR